MALFKRKNEEDKTEVKTVCSLLDSTSKKRRFLTVLKETISGTEILELVMHGIKTSRKDAEIVIDDNGLISDLINFLDTLPESGKGCSSFWLDCICFTDAMKLIYDVEDEVMYVWYFKIGSSKFRPKIDEIVLSKQQVMVLADRLRESPLKEHD